MKNDVKISYWKFVSLIQIQHMTLFYIIIGRRNNFWLNSYFLPFFLFFSGHGVTNCNLDIKIYWILWLLLLIFFLFDCLFKNLPCQFPRAIAKKILFNFKINIEYLCFPIRLTTVAWMCFMILIKLLFSFQKEIFMCG